MQFDTSVWNYPHRMRARIKNLATMLLTLAVMNLYLAIRYKSWFLIIINILYGIVSLPIFFSLAKWNKNQDVPQEMVGDEK